jgi:tetratricopeptide (TPR) repeat protein
VLEQGIQTPTHLAALVWALRTQGKLDEALQVIREILDSDTGPHHTVVAVWSEMALERPEMRAEAIDLVHRWLDQEGRLAPLPQRAEMYLRLANLLDKERRPDEAFQTATKAKSLLGVRSDPTMELALAAHIESAFTARRLRSAPYGLADENRPVFIVGMPRSGTSLVEQILSAHPAVHAGGEMEELGQITTELSGGDPLAWPGRVVLLQEYALEALAQRWLHPLAQLAPQALLLTDKMPHNFTYIGLIALLFPGARIIHVRRDPRDIALSIFFHHFTGHHPYAYHLEDLAQHYRFYHRLMAHWRRVLPIPIL